MAEADNSKNIKKKKIQDMLISNPPVTVDLLFYTFVVFSESFFNYKFVESGAISKFTISQGSIIYRSQYDQRI